MRKMLINLLMLTAIINANEGLIQSAFEYYNAKDYTNSYQVLQEAQLDKLNNPKLYFYLGRSAYELGKHEEALASYNKALKMDPENQRTRLEIARTLFTLKDYKNAKREFEAVLNSPIPPTVKNNIQRYLATIDKTNQKHFFTGALILGLGTDNNVLNNSDEGILTSANNLPNTPKKNSSYHQEILLLNHQYRADTRDLTWNSNIMGYNQGYKDASEANIVVLGLTTGPAYINGSFRYSLPFGYNKISYGGEDYLGVASISPRIDYLFTQTLSFNAQLAISEKKYKQTSTNMKNGSTASDRNSKVKEFSLGLNKQLVNLDLLSIKLVFANEREDSENITINDVNKNKEAVEFSYSKKITENYNVTGTYSYTKDDYLDPFSSTQERIDRTKNLSVNLNTKMTNNLSVDLKYTYTDSKSTINDVYSYKKSNYIASMTMLF